MLLRRIRATSFLSFGQVTDLALGDGLTVVTGPNGVGKSNLGRCLELCRAAIGPLVGAYFAVRHPEPPREVLDLYKHISRRFKLATKL